MPTKRSRVHPRYKTRYRVVNWPEYERGLVGRGDLRLWISQEAIDGWYAPSSGRPGGPRRYSDEAIETVHTLRLVLGLGLRQVEGFVRSLFRMMGVALDVPDHTTLSRRLRTLSLSLQATPEATSAELIVDSTGLSIVGEGEWAAARHGERGRRGWRKLHLGVDGGGRIVAQVLTDASVDDAGAGVAIVEHVAGRLTRVTADPGYDTHEMYAAAAARGARVVIPPIASARADERVFPRNPARDAIVRRLGEIGRRAWKREAGYHRQATVENAFFRYKTIIGPSLRARGEWARHAEARLGCVVLNRMRERAWPESVAIPA